MDPFSASRLARALAAARASAARRFSRAAAISKSTASHTAGRSSRTASGLYSYKSSESEDSSEDDDEDDDEVFSSALSKPRRGCCNAIAAKSVLFSLSFSSHCALIFGRPRLVMRHTLSNRPLPTTFWVTATVCSRFNTACHHPSGTYMISPGF